MKKTLYLLLALAILTLFGCGADKPEAAARKIFEQQVQGAGHEGLALDTSDLVFDLLEKDDNTALVAVSGRMAVNATLPLVKRQGQWVLDMPAGETAGNAPARP